MKLSKRCARNLVIVKFSFSTNVIPANFLLKTVPYLTGRAYNAILGELGRKEHMKRVVIGRLFEFGIVENCRVVRNAAIRMQKTIIYLG